MAKAQAKPASLRDYFSRNPDVTQAQLSRVVGVSEAYISELKSGRKSPSLTVAQRISDATGVSMRALLIEESVA